MANEAPPSVRRGWSLTSVLGPDSTPFGRLARTHACSAAGDGAVAIALAGSLFFSLDLQAARWRVILYLILTLAPFSVVAPLVGPLIDRARGGARWIIVGTAAARATVAFLMISHISSLLLFPEAFAMLVMGKGYQVAKSTYLPTTVHSDEELVASNSRLAVLSSLSGIVGAAPAALLSRFGGAGWAVALACGWFIASVFSALRIPAVSVRPVGAPSAQERAELSSAGVRLASSGMGLLRGTVGFLTLWIAFGLRARAASPFEFALVLGPLGSGAVIGAALAPHVRKRLSEEYMLGGALAVTAAAGLFSALIGGLLGAALIAVGVAVVSASAKLAFDSLVQRDAPHADHGRAFASYEARFQMLWVIGALIGVVLQVPLRAGFLLVALGATSVGALFVTGRRAIAAGNAPPRLTDVVIRAMSEPVGPPQESRHHLTGARGLSSVVRHGPKVVHRADPPPAPEAEAAPGESAGGDGDRDRTRVYADPTIELPTGADPTVIGPPPPEPGRGRD